MKFYVAFATGALFIFASGNFIRAQKPANDPAKPNVHATPAPEPRTIDSHTGSAEDAFHLGHLPTPDPPKPKKERLQEKEPELAPSVVNKPTTQATVQPPAVPTFSTPSVIWPSSAPTRQGESLATVLYGGSASVPGTFIYSPGLSFIPPRGISSVTVTFLPADLTRYSSVTGTVVVKVR